MNRRQTARMDRLALLRVARSLEAESNALLARAADLTDHAHQLRVEARHMLDAREVTAVAAGVHENEDVGGIDLAEFAS